MMMMRVMLPWVIDAHTHDSMSNHALDLALLDSEETVPFANAIIFSAR